jgi:metal-sulfur cluster biosynthetic enzyme
MDSDPINANPTVLDTSALPTREAYKPSLSKAHSLQTSLLRDIPDKYTGSLTSVPFSLFDNFTLSDPEEEDDASSLDDSASEKGATVTTTATATAAATTTTSTSADDELYEPIDSQEIFDLISTISDPEHPLSLGQLAVVNLPHIWVTDSGDPAEIAEVYVEITPTITHCSLATLIGLGIRVRLERCLPARYRIVIKVREGTHQSERQVNKQLNDKERVAAACENEQLLGVISNMLATCK